MAENLNNDILENQNNLAKELEELKEAIAYKGLDIKDIVNEMKIFKQEQKAKEVEATVEAMQKITKKVKSEKPGVDFELVVSSYPDFAIKRTTAKTERIMIIMPSSKTYFIKTVKGNDVSREELTRENYVAFTQGMPLIEINDFWLDSICGGTQFYDSLMRYLSDDIIIEMLKKHCPPEFKVCKHDYRYSNILKKHTEAFEACPQLYKENYDNNRGLLFIVNNLLFIKEIQDTYSLEKARIFVQKYTACNVKGKGDVENCYNRDQYLSWTGRAGSRGNRYSGDVYGRNRAYDDLSKDVTARPNVTMDFDTMTNYFLYQSVRMGYRDNISSFFDDLNDCYYMQSKMGDGKIKVKYPNSLPTYHQCLSQDFADAKIIIDEEQLKHSAEECKKYEGKVDGYIFTCPKSKDDILDEAKQQCNCLASYIPKYTDGECMLFFMRKEDSPETSCVTIEVVNDEITQQYEAHNRQVSPARCEIIQKWFNKKFKKQNEIGA